jgi:hypothetical protein
MKRNSYYPVRLNDQMVGLWSQTASVTVPT